MTNFEFSILDSIQRFFKCSALDCLMPKISFLGDIGWLWISIALILLFIKKHRYHGVKLLVALSMGLIVCNVFIKNLVARARPSWSNELLTLLVKNPTDYSFPSGHTMASFASAYVIYKLDKRLGIAAYVLSCLIAFSRMYLYVHFPTDVLAGAILGTLFGFIAVKVVDGITNR